MKCLQCGLIELSRKGQKFCSSHCRQSYHNKMRYHKKHVTALELIQNNRIDFTQASQHTVFKLLHTIGYIYDKKTGWNLPINHKKG